VKSIATFKILLLINATFFFYHANISILLCQKGATFLFPRLLIVFCHCFPEKKSYVNLTGKWFYKIVHKEGLFGTSSHRQVFLHSTQALLQPNKKRKIYIMKIGLISDTHSFLEPKVACYFSDCDEIWHAGDIGDVETADKLSAIKPLRAVVGNIDGKELQILYPEHQVFVAEGVKVWITHIGGYPPHYTTKLKASLAQIKPDLFICGHSHILRVIADPERKLLHINPGAAGNHGFHKIKTIITFHLLQGKISQLDVVELGQRGSIPASLP